MRPLSPSRSCLRACLCAFGALALAATSLPSEALADGVIITSDYSERQVRIFDPDSGKILYDLPTWGEAGQAAGCFAAPTFCAPMGFTYVNYGDTDYLDLAMSSFDREAESMGNIAPSTITRLELSSPPTAVWQLRYLDFTDIAEADRICVQGDDEAYGDPAKAGCSLQFVHEFRVSDDNPILETVSVVVADSLNGRILGVTLDYSRGSNVGHVDWVLGPAAGEWVPGFPNGVQYIDAEDGEYILVTYYAEGELSTDGGPLVLYRWEGDRWVRSWQFPDPDAGPRPYLYAPHMAQLLTDPVTGERLFFYAHGRGLADAWDTNPNRDLGGTLGILRPGPSLSDPPTYLGEFALDLGEGSDGILYSRDIELLSDGTVLLSDAACESNCVEQARIFRLDAFHHDLSPVDEAGYYTPDHAEQAITSLVVDAGSDMVSCGIGGIFESDFVETERMGRHLRAAARRARRTCDGYRP